jgi:hypothetical protein
LKKNNFETGKFVARVWGATLVPWGSCHGLRTRTLNWENLGQHFQRIDVSKCAQG